MVNAQPHWKKWTFSLHKSKHCEVLKRILKKAVCQSILIDNRWSPYKKLCVHSEVFFFSLNLISSFVIISFDRDFKESYSGCFDDAGMLTPVTHVVFSLLVL